MTYVYSTDPPDVLVLGVVKVNWFVLVLVEVETASGVGVLL